MLETLQSLSDLEFGAIIGGTIIALVWLQTQVLLPRTY